MALRRNSFKNDVYYYVRAYTYDLDEDNRKYLGNGSQRLKWRTDHWNKVEATASAVTDPVVQRTEEGVAEVNKDEVFDFGELRISAFDTFTDFNWSKPVKMAKSDYDGFLVRVSTKADLSDPIIEATVNQEQYSARVKGLSPNTQYYAAAYFYDRSGGENQTFGNKNIKGFKTIAAIPRDGSTRASRNIVKIEKKVNGRSFIVGVDNNVAVETTTTTTNNSVNTDSKTALRARISALKAQISTLQSELNRLEAQVGDTPTTVAPRAKTNTRRSSTGNNRLSKLRELLKARRGQ